MSVIRTNAAAVILGVSPNTLRSWERRFGYPKPRAHAGRPPPVRAGRGRGAARGVRGDAQHLLGDLARPRARRGPARPRLASRPRSGASTRTRPTGCWRRASRCARSSAPSRRCCCPPSRSCDDGRAAGPRVPVRVALQLGLAGRRAARRAARASRGGRSDLRRGGTVRRGRAPRPGARARPPPRRAAHACAARRARPEAARPRAARARARPRVVLAGRRAELDVFGRLVYAARAGERNVEVFDFRGALPDTGASTVRRLGDELRRRARGARRGARRAAEDEPRSHPAAPARAAARRGLSQPRAGA